MRIRRPALDKIPYQWRRLAVARAQHLTLPLYMTEILLLDRSLYAADPLRLQGKPYSNFFRLHALVQRLS